MITKERLNPDIWGPHYWFTIYTIGLSYPNNPDDIIKRKYYDFFTNIPIFIPDQDIGKIFTDFLNNYPVTPYLDSRESIIKWIHFIHNKINQYIGKQEITYYDALNRYYKNYDLKSVKIHNDRKNRERYIFYSLLVILILVILYFINK